MRMRPGKLATIAALVVLAATAVAWFVTRPPRVETCFDRLGGPGPNSNTGRLDTTLDIPADQWPALAQILRGFAAERGWSLQEGSEESGIAWLDMCDDKVTIVRASNEAGRIGGANRPGFEIIHMNYEGPGNDGWRPYYREIHRRVEARWPGRLTYVEGEFGEHIPRPPWLDAGWRPEPVIPPRPVPSGARDASFFADGRDNRLLLRAIRDATEAAVTFNGHFSPAFVAGGPGRGGDWFVDRQTGAVIAVPAGSTEIEFVRDIQSRPDSDVIRVKYWRTNSGSPNCSVQSFQLRGTAFVAVDQRARVPCAD